MKKGGIRNLNSARNHFNAFINDLNLIDVRNSNGIFTWNNKQTRDRGIAYRLDQFLLLEWVMMEGGDLKVVVFPVASSNHWPISLEWENVGVKPHKPFRFEKLWLLHPDFHEKLKEWWDSFPPIRGTRMYQLQ